MPIKSKVNQETNLQEKLALSTVCVYQGIRSERDDKMKLGLR